MRLAVLSLRSCPVGKHRLEDDGGIADYVRDVALALGKQCHAVDIFTSAHPEPHPAATDVAERVQLIHIPDADLPPYQQSIYNHVPELVDGIETCRIGRGYRYDAIFSHGWISGAAGQFLKNRWSVPHAVMFHTLGLGNNTTAPGENGSDLRSDTEKSLVSQADKIIAFTQKEKRTLSRFYQAPLRKVSVIPGGVNLELFHPLNRKTARQQIGLTNEKCVLYVGGIEPVKGLDNLIKAVARVALDIPRVKLIICCGDNPAEIAKLQSLTVRLNVADKVVFTPEVPREQLPVYYSAADIFALPSYYESFGVTALEALACGTPVVASDVGNLVDIIEPAVNGYITPNNSPGQLAAWLKTGLRTDFADSNRIRQSVARYSWDKIAGKIIRQFDLLEKKRR